MSQTTPASISSILSDRGILGEKEIVTSTELVRRLQNRGYAPGTARQLLRRGYVADKIWRSESLVLPAGGRLFARLGFFGDQTFLRQLRPILIHQRPGLGRVLDALLRWEALDIEAVKKITAVRLDPSGSGTKLAQELSAISEVGIGIIDDPETGDARLVRRQFHGTPKSLDLAKELSRQREIQQSMVRIIVKHYRSQHLVAWQTPDAVRETPYNGQLFSAVGYSHLRPLVRLDGDKRHTTPVVFDVLARPAEDFDVAGFVERIYRAGYHTKSKLRMLGVIAAPTFSPSAFSAASQAGLAIVSFKQLFGEAAIDALAAAQQLRSELKEVGAEAVTSEPSVNRFAESIVALKNNPVVSDLCGIALETYAVACIRSLGYENVASNRQVPFTKGGVATTRDVDASGQIDDAWHVIECKALGKDVALREDYVKYFFQETVPAFLNWAGRGAISTCKAEIWTTGTVNDDIKQLLSTLRLDRRVVPAILTKGDIPRPKAIKSLGRILDVISDV